jgi:hypothetical protein
MSGARFSEVLLLPYNPNTLDRQLYKTRQEKSENQSGITLKNSKLGTILYDPRQA